MSPWCRKSVKDNVRGQSVTAAQLCLRFKTVAVALTVRKVVGIFLKFTADTRYVYVNGTVKHEAVAVPNLCRISSRENTRPGCLASMLRIPNSLGDRRTSLPFDSTSFLL